MRRVWCARLLAFAGSLILYLVCLDSGASLWDCPEYITNAVRLEPGHPPGNPAWALMANVAAGMAPSRHMAATAINFTSALSMALAVVLLFDIILWFLKRFLFRGKDDGWAVMAALCGTMCFAWADSVIFSAVEAEVYALSVFVTALQVWLMQKWADAYERGWRDQASRMLVAQAYITGLSLGVHELNLLAITALSLIYIFTRHHGGSPLRAWGSVAISFVIIGGVLLLWFPGVISVVAATEVRSVRTLGSEPGVAAIWAVVSLLVVLFALPFLAARMNMRRLVTPLWMLAFLTLGSGVYLLIPVRAAAAPPMNQGAPSHPYALLSYVKRDQYGSKPLFKGQTPYSAPLRVERIDSTGKAHYDQVWRKKGRPLYHPYVPGAVVTDRCGLISSADSAANRSVEAAGRGYLLTGYTYDYSYAPELDMWFSRLTSGSAQNIESYADWCGMTPGAMEPVEACNAVDQAGRPIRRRLDPQDAASPREGEHTLRPTYLQQLEYLLGYQTFYMYFRYLLWNFSGRQNNYPAAGEIDHGNFITGFPIIDNAMLGDQSMMPAETGRENRGHNVYYMIPLLLGIFGGAGACRYGRRGRRASAVVLALFLMTGLAIVFYLNQDPRQARERDYAFLGSYLAFAIWISFGIGIMLKQALRKRSVWVWPVCAFCAAVPLWMLGQNADDHQRGGRHSAAGIGISMLESLPENAILFVDGDNHTFPLWYVQEVLGVRRDVRVINIAYLSTPWYAAQLLYDGEKSKALPLVATYGCLAYDAFSMARYDSNAGERDAVEALREMYDNPSWSELPCLRASAVRWPSATGDSVCVRLSDVASGSRILQRTSLMLLDILASNAVSASPRPVYWQRNLPGKAFAGLRDSTQTILMTRRLPDGRDPLDEGIEALAAAIPAASRQAYVEPYAGASFGWQRMSGVLLALRLQRAGRLQDAVSAADRTLALWPLEQWPSTTVNVDGDTVNEAYVLAGIYEAYGAATGDTAISARGRILRKKERIRREEFGRYKRSLGPERASVVSF